MQDYKKLMVWQKAHALSLLIYKMTESFPKHELYGLVSQIRRAVVSIATNIAEGSGRNSNLDFSRFLQIAYGSASEVEYLILLSAELNYISIDIANKMNVDIQEIKKMLTSLLKKLRTEN
ncbi:MAG: four helix bundle protein [Ignavibacteriaceae bacterium]|jgi:four helix bundle protein